MVPVGEGDVHAKHWERGRSFVAAPQAVTSAGDAAGGDHSPGTFSGVASDDLTFFLFTEGIDR